MLISFTAACVPILRAYIGCSTRRNKSAPLKTQRREVFSGTQEKAGLMGWIFLALFIGLPLIEIMVFITVGDLVGGGWTLGLVILTAVVGTALIRAQGFALLARIRTQLGAGVIPARDIFRAFCLLIAGVLILTPGFVTDAVGLCLFLPTIQDVIRGALGRMGRGFAAKGQNDFRGFAQGEPRAPKTQDNGTIIDADFEDLPPQK